MTIIPAMLDPSQWVVEDYDERFCRPLDLDAVDAVLVHSGLGTGKTEVVGRAFQKYRPASIILISPRYLYSISVQKRWVTFR